MTSDIESKVKLIKPNIDFKESYINSSEEFAIENGNNNFSKEKIENEFDAYLQIVEDNEAGKNLPEQFDKQYLFWLVDENEFIGRVVIRHRVISDGLHTGWHLGYSIRPSKRKMGYGTQALNMGLEKLKELGINKVYLVCDSDNIPSKKMLENAGCKFEAEIPSVKEGEISRLEYSLEL